jgi:PAS domain S-box-containing protein
LKHKDGRWIWIHDKGKVLHWSIDNQPLSMYGIHQDITSRKERELRLVYQENILHALFLGSPVGIVLTDFDSAKYLDLNNAFLDLLGYEKDALMKMTYEDITPNGYREKEKLIKQDLLEKSYYTAFHKEYIKKDGTLVSVIIQGVLIQDTEGRDLVWTFVQDMTKEKKAENEIGELLLLTQDQNDRLHNFARIVSHNLKNHSDGILGILELLSEQNPEIAENRYLKLFEKSAKNLVQTISFLSEEKLLLSKLGSIFMEKVDFSALLYKNIESLAAELLKCDFIIDNQVSSGIFIKGVFAYLDSIILNLISNALKYKRPNSLSQLTIKHVSTIDFEVVEFIDNGLGIDLALHGNDVFGLYKTFHENKDSRGIGLFISKNQIEQMGGKIQVESQLNQGSTFRLFLQKN